MRKVISKSVVMSVLYALTTTAYSAPQWYFTLGAGMQVPDIHSTATVNNNSLASPPYNVDSYSRSNDGNAALLLEVGQYWLIAKAGLNSLSLGLQYQYFLPTDVGRQIMQYSMPEFLNYHYKLDLEANILLLNAKVELFSWKNIAPFVNVGAGAVQLIAKNYNEYPYSGITARTSPAFQNHASYGLTYQVGAGINWKLNQTLVASINYLYHPLGRFTTKNGSGAWSNRKLDFNNASSQAGFITITYLA